MGMYWYVLVCLGVLYLGLQWCVELCLGLPWCVLQCRAVPRIEYRWVVIGVMVWVYMGMFWYVWMYSV